jgi:hypothetical protein
MMTTFAVFQQSGKYWRLKQAFNINKMWDLIAGKHSLTIAIARQLRPGATLEFKEFTAAKISQDVIEGGAETCCLSRIAAETKLGISVRLGRDDGSLGKKCLAQLAKIASGSR